MSNWLTVILVLILLWSTVVGIRRGFAAESGYIVALIGSIIAGFVAIWLAWWGSAKLSTITTWSGVKTWPDWAIHIIAVWKQSPRIAQLITFVVLYLVISGVLHRLLSPFPKFMARAVPTRWSKSRLIGGLLGLVAGVPRAMMVGAGVFVALQYFAFPTLSAEALHSTPYQFMSRNIYEPWLKPFLTSELPVLEAGALAPLAQNINLFVLPTGQGREQGVLIVPKQIATLAKQLTKNDRTSRQKAYALYEWEIHHIHYDWKKYDDYVYHHKWDQQSPLTTLNTGKGVCADYALLYADMAHSVGLTVQIDEGIGGVGSESGSHAWNKVWLAQSKTWICVDTTWGAEQDAWFDVPQATFAQTHAEQSAITIAGATA